jgi:hypothetical protein
MANVIVQHQIKDPETFFSRGDEVIGNAPAGVRSRQFCPSQDHTAAVCLWEGDLDAVREYVDSVSEGVAINAYFEIDEEYAFGLPEQAGTSA